jgi:Flp pilus assembly protein CpaB
MIPRPSGRRRRLLRLPRLRHPVPFWIAAVALTALTTATVARASGAAVAERDRWGVQVPVVVATADLAPGDALRGTVELRPAATVPDGAVSTLDPGAVVAQWIGAGEIVLAARLAPAGLSAIAGRLPPRTRGVAIPIGIAPLPVAVGDHVDVFGSSRLSVAALVVAVTDEAVTIAVAERDAADVAYEAAAGTVTLVLTATPTPRSR